MFTLWYAYLGYQEYRRRGHSLWTKHDSSLKPSRPTMESTSTTTTASVSDTGFISKRNEEPNIETADNQIGTPELSTSRSNITVKPAVSQVSDEYETKMISKSNDESEDVSDAENHDSREGSSSSEGTVSSDTSDNASKPVFAKDSRLLLQAKKSSAEEQRTGSDTKSEKKISFSDREGFENDNGSVLSQSREELSMMPVAPTFSTSGSVVGRMLVEGSDEPMRCWMTEGDHPIHPVSENCVDNIKVITNRTRDSADSILRDSDEFLLAERRLTRQASLPKKVSISDEAPAIFLCDILPDEMPELGSDNDTAAKLNNHQELAAAAAAALKENWRKKTNLEIGDLDDEDKIVFGDTNVLEESQLLQISDDEASDSAPKEDII